MRVCSDCGCEKPEVCFAGSACVVCLGYRARRSREAARGLRLKKRVQQAESAPYPRQEPGEYTHVPLSYFAGWCKEMKSLLPTQWDSL